MKDILGALTCKVWLECMYGGLALEKISKALFITVLSTTAVDSW